MHNSLRRPANRRPQNGKKLPRAAALFAAEEQSRTGIKKARPCLFPKVPESRCRLATPAKHTLAQNLYAREKYPAPVWENNPAAC
jgi:hypothetical protein